MCGLGNSLKVIDSGLGRKSRVVRVLFAKDGDSMELYICWQ